MTIILDENVPIGLRRILAPRPVTTVQKAGYKGMKNGRLLALIDGTFDILITADKNLRYQQNLVERHIGIVELPTNRWPLLQLLEAEIITAVDSCGPSDYIIVGEP